MTAPAQIGGPVVVRLRDRTVYRGTLVSAGEDHVTVVDRRGNFARLRRENIRSIDGASAASDSATRSTSG